MQERLSSWLKKPLPDWAWIAAGMWFALKLIRYQLGDGSFDIQIPLLIYGDGLFHLLMAKRLIAGGGYFFDPALGFPWGSTLYDFPGSDGLSMLFLYVVGKLNASAFVAVNAYFLAGFPLAVWSFAVVARRLGVTIVLAVVGGILFACLPFHFLRLNHLYYTWYFVVPFYVWYGWKIYSEGARWPLMLPWRSVVAVVAGVLGLVALASTGIYYAVFGMIVILVAGSLGAVERRSFRPAGWAAGACAVIVVTVLANTAPNTLYKASHGPNTQVAVRVPQEADIYGLKIAQLLLPQPVHRLDGLRQVTQEYKELFPLVNENASSSLGLVGSLGFLGLLAFQIFGRREPDRPTSARYLSVTLFALLLIASMGGFGSLFAYFVSPMIRAWNRVSIFVAFLCLTAAMMGLAWQVARLRQEGRRGMVTAAALVAVVLCVGLFDQVGDPCDDDCALSLKGHVNRQRYFFANVQKALPAGTAIYNLPFMEFPETPPKYRLETYSLMEGYLYTSGLKWSYGAMKGRDQGDKVFRELEKRPMAEQVAAVRQFGFGAVMVDRRGYKDNGLAVERDLMATGKVRQAVDQDFRALYIINP